MVRSNEMNWTPNTILNHNNNDDRGSALAPSSTPWRSAEPNVRETLCSLDKIDANYRFKFIIGFHSITRNSSINTLFLSFFLLLLVSYCYCCC